MLRSLMSGLVKRSNTHRADDRLLGSDGYHVERLEDRMMLAGEVSVSVSGNNIRIVGDDLDNVVSFDASAGFVRVQGFTGTTIVGDVDPANGRTTVPSDDLNNLTIKLKDGNDRLFGGPVPSPPGGSVSASPESLTGAAFVVGGNLRVIAGAGNDEVFIFGTSVDGLALVRLGDGDDIMSTFSTETNGNLRVIAGGGNDDVRANALTANANVIFRGGAGDDDLTLGTISNVTLGGNRVNVRMGGGNDTLVVGDVSGNADANILWHGNGGTDSRNDFSVGTATVKSFEIVV